MSGATSSIAPDARRYRAVGELAVMASVLCSATFLFFGTSCRQNDDPAGAATLLTDVQAADYRSWDRPPGFEERSPSNSAHSENVEIYVNEVVVEALANGPIEEWPVGSVIAKDGFLDDGTQELIALMEKREDGWFWAEFAADGEVLYSGVPDICVDCHSSGSDYVRGFTLP